MGPLEINEYTLSHVMKERELTAEVPVVPPTQ